MGNLPRREYGNTGVNLSVMGFGGIVVTGAAEGQAVREAIVNEIKPLDRQKKLE